MESVMKHLFVFFTGIAILTAIVCTERVDMTEENKILVRRVFDELYNQGDLDVADEIYAPEYIWHNVSGPDVLGNQGMKEHVAVVRHAFPNINITAEDMIAEENKVVTRWTIVATHKGEFGGIPPTGVQVKFTGILISRIADGKIAEDWENSDVLGLMQQLGVIPNTEQGGRAAQP
jgi:steroid delta-isomerase-like uncharacterized protein